MIETIYSNPNYLEHHGVKGMKWGVRKQDNSNPFSSFFNSREKSKHPLAAKASGLKNDKNVNKIIKNNNEGVKRERDFEKEHSREKIFNDSKNLSDDDLKKAISRMNLERQYRQLKEDEAEAGRSYLGNKMIVYGDRTVDKMFQIESNNISNSYKNARV